VDTINPTNIALRRMNNRFDDGTDRMNHFMRQEMAGEHPDSAAFLQALEQRSVLQVALQAEFKLHEKPLKNVLNDVK
jgi:hypothetical protein